MPDTPGALPGRRSLNTFKYHTRPGAQCRGSFHAAGDSGVTWPRTTTQLEPCPGLPLASHTPKWRGSHLPRSHSHSLLPNTGQRVSGDRTRTQTLHKDGFTEASVLPATHTRVSPYRPFLHSFLNVRGRRTVIYSEAPRQDTRGLVPSQEAGE